MPREMEGPENSDWSQQTGRVWGSADRDEADSLPRETGDVLLAWDDGLVYKGWRSRWRSRLVS